MRLYAAGNFPQMKNPDLEKRAKKLAEDEGFTYRRLVSFFFKDECETILKIKRETEDE